MSRWYEEYNRGYKDGQKSVKSHEEYYDAIRAGDKLNCPNCGAPIDGEVCQYCGTVFVDMAVIDTQHPFYLKIKHEDQIHVVKVRMVHTEITLDSDEIKFYADEELYSTVRSQLMNIKMEFEQC